MDLVNELRQYAEDIFSVTGPNPQATMMSLAADEIVALAALVQEMRVADAYIFDGWSVYQEMPQKDKARTSYDNVSDVLDALAKLTKPYRNRSDNSAAILARRDAAIWMEAAKMCEQMWADNIGRDCESGYVRMMEALRAKADKLLKGLGKEQ